MQQRRQLVKACKKHGLRVQPAALQAMLKYDADGVDMEGILPILETISRKLSQSNGKLITTSIWNDCVQETKEAAVAVSSAVSSKRPATSNATTKAATTTEKKRTSSNVRAPWSITNAFDSPQLVYDSLRQQFYYKDQGESRPSLFGTVEEKIEMATQRFLRTQQRVTRNASSLTSVDRLLGTSASSTQLLLGMLHSTSTSEVMAEAEGVVSTGFKLEDLTGTVPLQFHANSQVDSSGLYTAGCFVLVEGYYDNGIFFVNRLDLPPIESKEKSQPYMPPAPSTLQGSALNNINRPLTIYSMSNVTLDDPNVAKELEDLVFDLSEREAVTHDVLLVLMGNFTTPSMSLPAALDELSRILESLRSRHTVVIIPGPEDSPSMCWPLPPIRASSSFSSQLQAKVQFATNPCRLHFGEEEILFCRQDLIRQHLQQEVLRTRESSQHKGDLLPDRVLRTALSQGHVLPHAPIYWNFDHAMSLYPLPNLLIAGLEESDEHVRTFEESGSHVICPGSQGNWSRVTLQKRKGRRGTHCSYIMEFSKEPVGHEREEKDLMDPDDSIDGN